MKRGFSFVELIIAVAILGILAAVAIPQFQSHSQQAKESAAKDNLRILRNAIELYAAQHNDVAPGYPDDDPSGTPGPLRFWSQLATNGRYSVKKVKNPFNGNHQTSVVANDEDFPTGPTADMYGWVYKPSTKEIRLNWPGTDSEGVRYFDY